jgi:tetratricopeptide (TPR) repeat protein
LDLRVKYYYVHNVDSAEILLNHILENLYRNDLSDKAFYPNLALAEFYQKYTPNKALSLKFMTTAMQIFIGNSEKLHLGSYAFVDIGNLFCNFGYYEQAIIFYRIAYDVGLKTDNINGASLSLQNIGNSFQFMHKLDSAFYYLNKAGADNRDTLNISRALNMNHLASLYFESHKMDEAEKYGLESISILEKFKNEHPEVVLGYNNSHFREWQAVRSSTDRFLMELTTQSKNLINLNFITDREFRIQRIPTIMVEKQD